MELIFAHKTDVGKVRDHNEDSYGFDTVSRLYFVCDGMGGHAAGDYASQMTVDTIKEVFKMQSEGQLTHLDLDEIQDVTGLGRHCAIAAMIANRRLFRMAVEYPKLRGMGTTFTGIVFEDSCVNILNVGDSRVYRVRGNKLHQLTLDHTWVEELIQDGEIQEQEADTFGKRNVITRAIGTAPEISVDWKCSKIITDDIYLLCSDGLCGEIKDDLIETIILNNKHDLDTAAKELIQAANDNGGNDNVTVILVAVEGDVLNTDTPKAKDLIVTIPSSKKTVTSIDILIDKKFPILSTYVPKGVTRDKPKFYNNTFLRVFIGMILLVTLFIVFKVINKNTPSYDPDSVKKVATKADILIRTDPDGAVVTLFKNGTEIAKKFAPADFLAVAEGSYEMLIEKTGYEKKTINLEAKKGTQEIKNIILNPFVKMDINLGDDPGFEEDEVIYIDGEPLTYYGTVLTVKRIGLVGKSVSISSDNKHIIRIGKIERTIKIERSNIKLKMKLDKGWIFVETEAL